MRDVDAALRIQLIIIAMLAPICAVAILASSVFTKIGWWSLPIAIGFSMTAITANRLIQMGMGEAIKNNRERAICLSIATIFWLLARMSMHHPAHSPWWGILVLPAFPFLSLVMSFFYEIAFNFIYMPGKSTQ